MDRPISPWAFLAGGAVFSVVAAIMLTHATTTSDHVLGDISGWLAVVLTVAGAASLGVNSGSPR